jgi:hypothetical protein
MAKLRCACGTVLRDDDPDTSMFLLTRREFDVEEDGSMLLGRATLAVRCPVCGRLWVFWGDRTEGVEYVEIRDEPGRDT